MLRHLNGLHVGLGALLFAGCSDPTATGQGRAEAVVADTPSGSPSVTGSLAGNVSASLSVDGVQWIDLGSPNGVTIPLQLVGSAATVHGEQDAAAGSYTRVRLIFQGVTARLAAGSVVGGTTLTAETTLSLGGSDQRVDLVVTVPTFTVLADGTVQRTITFDLRSHVWLTAAALQAGTIQDAALQSAVTATTRQDPR
jgi:hypothetical protein